MPVVSVVIPAYNQAHYLGAAIESVLAQTWADLEVIVVDDGSTDDTAGVAARFGDSRVRYVHQANRGLPGARNTGIRHSTGPYVTFLDSDDLFLPEKLARLVEALEQQPGAGLAAGQSVLIDEHGRPTGQPFISRLPDEPAELLLGNPLHVGSVLVRRAWLERVGLFDESLRSYEDWDLWLRLALAGCPMVCLDQPVAQYRFHSAQMTRHGAQMTAANFAVLDKVFAGAALPPAWQALRPRAYSHAHLRAAAHGYLAGDFARGQQHLLQATQLDPGLLAAGARPLAQHFAAWIQLPKTSDPLGFLDSIYRHLPAELATLARQRRRAVGGAALGLAFAAYQQGRLDAARAAVRRAVRCHPAWLGNRGVLAILLKTAWLPRGPRSGAALNNA